MAPLTVKIKASATDIFDCDIEEDETAETLGILIYSIRPDLGEELRIIHKGRILKAEATMAAATVQNGDVIAVANKAAPKAPAAAAPVAVAPAAPAAPTAPAATAPAATAPAVAPAATAPAAAPAATALAAAELAAAVAPAKLQFEPPARGDDGEPKKKSPRLEPASDPSPVAAATEALPAAASAEPAAPSESAQLPEAAAPAATAPTLPAAVLAQAHEAPAAGEAQPFSPAPASPGKEQSLPGTPKYPEVDTTTPAGLLAFAALLEDGTEPPPSKKLAELMRESALKMATLEHTVKELAQGLQMTNMISATCLRGLGASEASPSEGGSPSNSQQEEGSRSFLIKKGDSDLQEKHQAQSKPVYTESIGGALCSTPKSKEEMDIARQARLAKLEAQQADKQKEKDEANDKDKARQAMFTRRDEGKSKPLLRPQ